MMSTQGNVDAQAAHEFALETAKALGDGWTVEDKRDVWARWGATLQGPGGAVLTIDTWGSSKTARRINVNGSFPQGTHLPYQTVRPEISVSLDRGPVVLAREIQRRFLPAYLPLLEKMQEQKASSDAHTLASVTAARHFAEVMRTVPRQSEPARVDLPSRWPGYGHVQVSGDKAELSLRYVPVDVMRKVIDLLTAEMG